MKVLTWDIETAPNVGHFWGLWQQNIGLPQLLESGYVLCVAAKWEHEDKVRFHKGPTMLKAVHRLLSEADVVVGFNSIQFDEKWVHAEFARADMLPPSPYKSVDLLRVVKRNFRFPSNKLQYVAGELLGESKADTGGHATWLGCMANDPKSWARMKAYNEADVLLTERLFHRLKPWIHDLPIPGLYGEGDVGEYTCPQCGSNNVKKDGLAYTQLSAFQRYRCRDCGRFGRGGRRVGGVNVR